MDSSEDVLTLEDIHKAIKEIQALEQPMRRMTLSRDEVDVLRARSAGDTRATGMEALFGLPLVGRSDGNYRVVLPEDRQHIAEHGSGLAGCTLCFSIWWES